MRITILEDCSGSGVDSGCLAHELKGECNSSVKGEREERKMWVIITLGSNNDFLCYLFHIKIISQMTQN